MGSAAADVHPVQVHSPVLRRRGAGHPRSVVTQKAPWIIAGLAGVAVVGLLVMKRGAGPVGHPEPRPAVTAERVLPLGMVLQTPGGAEADAGAARASPVRDRIRCV